MKRKRGFTLIELLVTLAVLGAVGLLAYTLFGQGFSLYAEEAKSADQQTEMRLVLSEITNKARLTDEANISYVSEQLTIGDYVYVLNGNRVIRNSSELATDIAVFDVSIVDGLLEIRLVNIEGDQITTSLYLSD